jgi:hypothetical protein
MAAAQPRPVGVVIGHGPQIIEHVCDAPRPADLIGFGVVGSTMDVSGPSQAGGTPHPDWCRPLEVHGCRFAGSRPGVRLTQVVGRVIDNIDGPAAAREPDRDSTAMSAANSEQTPIETY